MSSLSVALGVKGGKINRQCAKGLCLSSLPRCCEETAGESEGFVLAQSQNVPSILCGNARRQEREAAGPLASTVKEQRKMPAGARLAISSFIPYQAQPKGEGYVAQFSVDLPTSDNLM